MIVVFCNMRFGWSLSGLVVPGYLVPLFIIKPWAASVVIFEGVATYFAVLYIFEYFSRAGLWSPVFGRDRFFALLVFSVIIRIIFDGYLLPQVGEFLNRQYSLDFDYRNQLHSFGLIIVALIANQFWKPGFFRGIIPLVVTLLATYVIVRYVLVEFTNFSISNLGYLYEDIASSMLASPKAYIILLTTAFLASHMNLNYGWEYSGILIPSLIALLWYQPAKIGVSLFETLVIIVTASLLLRLPVFKKSTIEGARKILLFFNISYAYKFILAYFILNFLPEKKITDYYGFGYLLPSLLAIKMHDKDIFARMTRVTLQTSLYAILVSSCLGFLLTLVPAIWSVNISSDTEQETVLPVVYEEKLLDVLRQEKIKLYKNRFSPNKMTPLASELDLFAQSLRHVSAYAETGNHSEYRKAQLILNRLDFNMGLIRQHLILINDKKPSRSWGTYIINRKSLSGLLIEVPVPLRERGILESGGLLFNSLKAGSLAIAGNTRQNLYDNAPPAVLTTPMNFFQIFHKEFGNRDVIQLRGLTGETMREMSGKRRKETDIELPYMKSSLWVKKSLPPGLNLAVVKNIIKDFNLIWEPYPSTNLQRETTSSGFAELFLNRDDMRRLFFKPLLDDNSLTVEDHEQSLEGYLQEWFLSGKEVIAKSGSEKYKIPRLEELLFFDEEVIKPILRTIRSEYKEKGWTDNGMADLMSISASAALLNYRIIRYHHKLSRQDYLILTEKEKSGQKRFWGTYIFRLGSARPYMIQIPRPLFELNVFEYGVSLFERFRAEVLMIAGAHKDANLDGSADIIRLQNMQNIFNTTSQAVLRENKNKPLMVVQARAMGVKEDQPLPDADLLISFESGMANPDSLSNLEKNLIQLLEEDQFKVRLVDGSRETAGYEVGGLPQSLYLRQTANKEFAILWLGPKTRSVHRQQLDNYSQQAQFLSLGIDGEEGYLFSYITREAEWGVENHDLSSLIEEFKEYVRYRDFILLKAIKENNRQLDFRYFIDLNTSQAYLLVYSRQEKLIGVLNLLPKNLNTSYTLDFGNEKETIIQRFIETRAFWLSKKESGSP